MPSELETYLAEVVERAKHASDRTHPHDSVRRSWQIASQADVKGLVEMLRTAALLARCDAGSNAAKGVTDKLHRLARAAMEKHSAK
jgi:hypothetical protein